MEEVVVPYRKPRAIQKRPSPRPICRCGWYHKIGVNGCGIPTGTSSELVNSSAMHGSIHHPDLTSNTHFCTLSSISYPSDHTSMHLMNEPIVQSNYTRNTRVSSDLGEPISGHAFCNPPPRDLDRRLAPRPVPLSHSGNISLPKAAHSSRKHSYASRRFSCRYRWGVLRSSAKRRCLPMEISYNRFQALIDSNCAYCGSKYPGDRLYGIDRIDANLGYTHGNVLPACKICNFMKGTLPFRDFLIKIHRCSKRFRHGSYGITPSQLVTDMDRHPPSLKRSFST